MSFEPKTSKEKYLATQAGIYDGDLPDPKTCEEFYLKVMAENPSSGGGTMYITISQNGPDYVLNKNFKEIMDAYVSGMGLVAQFISHEFPGATSVAFYRVIELDIIPTGGGNTVYSVIIDNLEGGDTPMEFNAYSDTGDLVYGDSK